MKPRKIEFFRYSRPLDTKTGLPHSNMGVTLYIRINYKKRWIRIAHSVCNGDNFSKEIGKQWCAERYVSGDYYQFCLEDFQASGMSVTAYLTAFLEAVCCSGTESMLLKQLKMESK